MNKPNKLSELEKLNENWIYEFEAWGKTAGFEPIELIASVDISDCYDMERLHVFKTKRGEYALVGECGCSCYDPGDADIDIYQSLDMTIKSVVKNEDEKYQQMYKKLSLLRVGK